MKRKAFTVIELIAVIVVLAVILAITVPAITGIIRSSTMRAVESDAKLVLDAIRIKKIEDNSFDPLTLNESNIEELLGLSNANYDDLIIQINDGKTYIEMTGQGKWAGFSACGSFFDMKVNEGECVNDFNAPVITMLGSSPVTIQVGSVYIDEGAVALDDIDGDITGRIVVTGTVNPNVVGTYIINYNVSDNAGHPAETVTRTVNVIDTTIPVVTFGTNGNATYAKTRSTTVTVSDAGGVNASSLKYQWTTSATAPSEASFVTGFTNGGTISTPVGVTGGYYLWILAKDNQNNTAIVSSNVFNLDNIKPVITINGNSNINVNRGSSYTDAGASATDNVDSSITVISTGTVDINTVGTYYITYNAADSSGNAADAVVRTVNVIDTNAPVITILGSNPFNMFAGGVYTDAGAIAVDDVDGDVTSRINTTGTVNPNIVGSYTITYTVSDNAGNNAIATRTVNVIDNVGPTIIFGMNGNSTWAKTRSSSITASDGGSGINYSSLKYLWSTSTSTPSEASFSTGFSNGGTVSTPAGATGGYYLWAIAKDNAGNTTIARTNVFNIDNTPPGVPTLSIHQGVSTAYTPGTWATNSVSALANCPADTSGIASYYQYSTDNYNWSNQNTGYFVVFYDGTVVSLYLRCVDNAGNIGSATSAQSIKVDMTPPTMSEPIFRLGSASGSNYTVGNWATQNVYAVLSSQTDVSGLKNYQYSNNGSTWTDMSTGVNSQAISTQGTTTWYFRAKDNAGNTGGGGFVKGPYTVKVDTVAPSAPTVSFKLGSTTGSTYTPGTTTNQSVYAVLSYTPADTSGINHYETKTGSGSWVPLASNWAGYTSTTYPGWTVSFRVVDNAGNVGAATSTYNVVVQK